MAFVNRVQQVFIGGGLRKAQLFQFLGVDQDGTGPNAVGDDHIVRVGVFGFVSALGGERPQVAAVLQLIGIAAGEGEEDVSLRIGSLRLDFCSQLAGGHIGDVDFRIGVNFPQIVQLQCDLVFIVGGENVDDLFIAAAAAAASGKQPCRYSRCQHKGKGGEETFFHGGTSLHFNFQYIQN